MNRAFKAHIKPLGMILGVSFFGILASAVFQLIAIRSLGATDYARFAAYVAVINIVAIGSAALRNSVAVAAAGGSEKFLTGRLPLSRDGSRVEAIVLSVISIAMMLVSVLPMNLSSGFNAEPLILSALIIIPSFFFARSQGFIQGRGKPQSVVYWTTGMQILQVLALLVVSFRGISVNEVLAVMAITSLLGAIGAGFQVRIKKFMTPNPAFTAESVIVLLLTIVFAWLTNIDVLYVSTQGAASSGFYAANAVLVKTTFIIPTALMLYMLPRFARLRAKGDFTKRETNPSLVITSVSAVLVFMVFFAFGNPIIQLLYGDAYAPGATLLPWMSLMWLPWVLVQTALIPLTAFASKAAVIVLLFGALAQWITASFCLPNLGLFMTLNGVLGSVIFAGLLFLQRLYRQQSARSV